MILEFHRFARVEPDVGGGLEARQPMNTIASKSSAKGVCRARWRREWSRIAALPVHDPRVPRDTEHFL